MLQKFAEVTFHIAISNFWKPLTLVQFGESKWNLHFDVLLSVEEESAVLLQIVRFLFRKVLSEVLLVEHDVLYGSFLGLVMKLTLSQELEADVYLLNEDRSSQNDVNVPALFEK